MKRLLVKVVIIFCFLICLPNSFSADSYVDISQSDDTGDGAAWGTAKKYLQSALTAASSGDNIYVAQGTYYPDEGTGQTDNARTSSFQLISGVNVYGGYANGSTNETKNGGGMYNYDSSPTVTNCTFSENTVTQYGGAVHNESNSATTQSNSPDTVQPGRRHGRDAFCCRYSGQDTPDDYSQ